MALAYSDQLSLFVIDNPAAPDSLGKAKVSEICTKQILAKGAGSLKDFDFTLNPYIGCGFGCSYCYASFFQAEQSRFDTWGTWIEIKANAEALLRKKRDLKGKKILMSSATDPYQPLEGKVELTRKLVETMSDRLRQPWLVVQTRGPLVTRDIDLFKRFDRIRVNMSITTDSDTIRKQFEPGCASIERRLEAISEVKAAGLETCVMICPMLPIEDPEAFGRKLRATRADRIATGFFHKTDRQFAANTRDAAWHLAESYGWTRESYKRTVQELRKHLPELNGFGFGE